MRYLVKPQIKYNISTTSLKTNCVLHLHWPETTDKTSMFIRQLIGLLRAHYHKLVSSTSNNGWGCISIRMVRTGAMALINQDESHYYNLVRGFSRNCAIQTGYGLLLVKLPNRTEIGLIIGNRLHDFLSHIPNWLKSYWINIHK